MQAQISYLFWGGVGQEKATLPRIANALWRRGRRLA